MKDTQELQRNHTAQLLAVHLVLPLVQQHTCQGTSAALQEPAEAQKDNIVTLQRMDSRGLHQGYCLEPLWCCQHLV